MKHFYRLNRWQWLAVLAWTALSAPSLHIFSQDSTPVIILRVVFSFVIGYGLLQSQIRQQVYPLSLIVKASSGRKATIAENELFDQLHSLFKSSFPKDSVPILVGFDSNDEQLWFHFKGANPDVIVKAIQPLLKDIPLPPGSHLVILTGPNTTEELPVFASI